MLIWEKPRLHKSAGQIIEKMAAIVYNAKYIYMLIYKQKLLYIKKKKTPMFFRNDNFQVNFCRQIYVYDN